MFVFLLRKIEAGLVLQEKDLSEFPISEIRRLVMLEMFGGVRRPVKLNLLKAYILVKRLGRLLTIFKKNGILGLKSVTKDLE